MTKKETVPSTRIHLQCRPDHPCTKCSQGRHASCATPTIVKREGERGMDSFYNKCGCGKGAR